MQSPAIGEVPTSYVGTLPDLQPIKVPAHDLVLKLTPTGVTFLHDQRFRKRYTGSTTCAVDLHGGLWLNAKEHDKWVKGGGRYKTFEVGEPVVQQIDKGKKKRVRKPPDPLKLLDETTEVVTSEPGAISEEFTDQQNLPPQSEENALKVAKKPRKKAYTVDKGKVRQRILAMINTRKGKKHLYFWTVSFPAHTPDNVCYQAFNTWLTSLRQRKMLKEYLWIAERQTGERLKIDKEPTNTIHFHIAIPHFMNAQRANAMMRGTLKNLARRGLMPGAVCNTKSGETYLLPCIAKYNGVDICKNRKTGRVVNFAVKKGSRALATYLTKYVTKNNAGVPNEQGEIEVPGFDHLAWHNSRGFSSLFTGITCTLEEFKRMGFGGYLNRVRVFKMNFATFVPWLYGAPQAVMEHLFSLNSIIQTVFDEQSTTN